jgi:ABC-2 type transport system permease protein
MLNTSFGLSALRWRYIKRRERLWEAVAALFGLGVFAVMFGYGAYRVLLSVTTIGASIGQPELGLGLAITMSQAMVLLLSFFMVVSAFYFARDLQLLVPLPVRPGEVITAKFLTVLIGEYVTVAVIYLPSILAYFRVVPFSAVKLVASILVFLALPILPMAITSLLAMVFMRSINRRQRDLLFYAGSLLFFGLIIAWQFAVARVPEGNLEEYLRELITSRFGLLRAVASRFPPAFWATLAIHGWPGLAGAGGLLTTLGLGLGSILLLNAVGDRLFYRGLIGGQEVTRGRTGAAARRLARRASLAGAEGILKPARSPFAALFWREWALLLRTPIWVVNNVLPLVIMPLFMGVVIFSRQGGLRQIISSLAATPNGYTFVGLGIAAYMSFLGGMGGLGATSVSREGARFWISRVAPQPARTQVNAKLLMASSAVLGAAAPTLAIVIAVLRPPFVHVAGGLLAGVAWTLAITAIGLRVDLARPMLRWQDPREPVKTNINALISMGIFAFAVLIGVFVARMLIGPGQWPAAAYLGLIAVGGLVVWVALVNLWNHAEDAYARLEV